MGLLFFFLLFLWAVHGLSSLLCPLLVFRSNTWASGCIVNSSLHYAIGCQRESLVKQQITKNTTTAFYIFPKFWHQLGTEVLVLMTSLILTRLKHLG